MPSFDRDFIESKGCPIIYKGIELVRADRIPVNKEFSGSLRVISTNSERRQGVRIEVDGKMSILGHEGYRFILWADNVIKDGFVNFKGKSKNSILFVYNAWDFGRGGTDCWQNGAAMIVEVDGNTRRYRCNDFTPDDDFDDIVFEVTIDE